MTIYFIGLFTDLFAFELQKQDSKFTTSTCELQKYANLKKDIG